MFGKLFSRSNEEKEQLAFETKSTFMESVLGKEHDIVMHAIIPFSVGGTLDLYYYPSFSNGTAIATKELSTYKFNGPKNSAFDSYELVMVSKSKLDLDSVHSDNPLPHTFSFDHKYINSALNYIGRYSIQAKLNPYETIEFPQSFETVGGKCYILDSLSNPICDSATNNKKFGLMLVMEIHRDEMEYAMQQKGKELIQLLKDKNIYPFSGIDRLSVLN